MNPIARPPLGPPTAIPSARRDLPLSLRAVGRVLPEISGYLSDLDPMRILWDGSRILPAFAFVRTRSRLLGMLGCDIRSGAAVLGHVTLVGPKGALEKLRIGPGCIIAPGVTLCLDAPITLGKNVSLGPRSTLYTATHSLGGESRRMSSRPTPRPIVVDDGAWIGLGAVVLAGVRVGRGAVVAAGSVVNTDVPDNVLVAGNPATFVEDLPRG